MKKPYNACLNKNLLAGRQVLKPACLAALYSSTSSIQKNIKCLSNPSTNHSILNFFPYDKLNIPENCSLLFDNLVFKLIDNSSSVLLEAKSFFSNNFFPDTQINYVNPGTKVLGNEKNNVYISVCQYSGVFKLSFSKHLSNSIFCKIFLKNSKYLEKKPNSLTSANSQTLNLLFL